MRNRFLKLHVFALWMAAVAAAYADPADDFIRAEMKRQNIPGLAVAVVKDGRSSRLPATAWPTSRPTSR